MKTLMNFTDFSYESQLVEKMCYEILNENASLTDVLNKTVKNPKTGKLIKVSSILKNKNHPMHAKIKDSVDKFKAKNGAKETTDDDNYEKELEQQRKKINEIIEKLAELRERKQEIQDTIDYFKDEGDDEEVKDWTAQKVEITDEIEELKDDLKYERGKLEAMK